MAKSKFIDLTGLSAFKRKITDIISDHMANSDIHKSSSEIRNELTYDNIINALGYTPATIEQVNTAIQEAVLESWGESY